MELVLLLIIAIVLGLQMYKQYPEPHKPRQVKPNTRWNLRRNETAYQRKFRRSRERSQK